MAATRSRLPAGGDGGSLAPEFVGYAKGRAKRAEILAVATAVFGDVGYHSASLVEIAAKCNLSRPGLVHYFSSKEALLEAVLDERDKDDAAAVIGVSPGAQEVLRGVVELASRNANRPGIVALYVALSAEATSPNHPAHSYFQRRYARVRQTIADALIELAATGDLRSGIDPMDAAVELVALMDGLQIQWLLDPEGTDMPAILESNIERLRSS